MELCKQAHLVEALTSTTMTSAKGNIFDQYKCIEVYNALDDGQFAEAVYKANELLSAGPLPLASALKTLALFRLGHREEADREATKLLQGSVDLNVLSPLEYVLPRIGKTHQLADLYMAASNAHPKDDQLADGALVVLVKAEMFQRASQMLLKRFRSSKNAQDFWRYIQVAILYSQRVKPPGSKLTLDIALRLLNEQQLTAQSFTAETFSLYLNFFILLGESRLAQALEMLKLAPIQELVNKDLGIQFQVRKCWKILDDKQSILSDCRTRIMKGDRNWAVISLFTATMAELAHGSMDASDVQVILDAAKQDGWKDRGSFLGVLELCRLSAELDLATPAGLDYPQLVLDYARQYASKLTCFDDLRPYFGSLNASHRDMLLECFSTREILTSEPLVYQRINAGKVSLLFDTIGCSFSVEELLKAHGESLQHVRLPSTEMQPGDDLALMAAYKALLSSPGTKGLVQAASIASSACQKSEHAYKLRIFLIRVLLRLGCPSMAMNHLHALKLKAVQLDTVTHVALDRNASFGGSHAADVTNEWESNIKGFYDLSSFEVPEAVGRAFLNGKFSQVSDLCEFHDCIEGSYARIILLLDIIQGKLVTENLAENERAFAVELVRDFERKIEGTHIA